MFLSVVLALLLCAAGNLCPSDSDCQLANQLLQSNSSLLFLSPSSISFVNVTLICFGGLQSQQNCAISLNGSEIVLSNSTLFASLIELNADSVTLDESTLSANGTAPFVISKACLDKGGSYGGRGGGSCRAACSDVVYGSWAYPTSFGSPGQGVFATGGGRVVVTASSLFINGGEISAAGNLPLGDERIGTQGMTLDPGIGGGSGGSVLIATETYWVQEDIVITVAGGSGGSASYGGGGGRVAIYGSGPSLRVIMQGGIANDTSRVCVLGGAGTLYVDELNLLVVDNNGVRTNNITPLKSSPATKLEVLNGAEAAPFTQEAVLEFSSISIVNALVVQAVDKSQPALPNLLNISAPVLELSNDASVGSFDETWIEIHTQNMTIDTTSGLFFGGFVNISAFYVVLNGEIVGNVQTPTPTVLFIYSQYVDILSEGIITVDTMGIVSWGGTFYLQGDIESPGSTCTTPSLYESNPVYQCLDPATNMLQYPDLSALLPSNFTIFILATSSLEVVDSGKVLGSRIAVCSEEVTVEGTISSTGFGCISGTGVGRGGYLPGKCFGSGGGYGGSGGASLYPNGSICEVNPGGASYGLPNETWYEGSGGGSAESVAGAGGGFISVTGTWSISISQGKLMANGEDSPPSSEHEGAGGGAGGSIWLTTQYLFGHLGRIWAMGGKGAGMGAGGGGGRVLLQWIGRQGPAGTPNSSHGNCSQGWVLSNVSVAGGMFFDEPSLLQSGSPGSFVSLQCSPGHFGPFCLPCEVGFYKEDWEYSEVCQKCANKPVVGTYTRTAWHSPRCPYRCPEAYTNADENPHCYSPLEVFISYFGGPGGAIGVFLGAVGTLTALGFLAHAYTVKFVLKRTAPKPQRPNLRCSLSSSPIYSRKTMSDASPELTREDLPFHNKRFYLLGDNSYRRPWALPLVPSKNIAEDVIAEEFANFADRINSLLRWKPWEFAVLVGLTVLYHPVGRLWLHLRRKRKYTSLMDFIRTYEEVLWKRVDLRELGNCLKVSASHCYTVAALDIMNPSKKVEEWDERPDLPFSIFCNGDGTFFCPYRLDNADLMLQILAYSLNAENLEKYYQFIDEFNTLARTYDFHSEFPDTGSPPLGQLIALTARYNGSLFNDRGFEVVPCLFQSVSTVHSGRYVFTSFSYSFTNDIFNVTSRRLHYQDSAQQYCYKFGLVVVGLTPRTLTNEPRRDSDECARDSMHWQPLALDSHCESLLSSNQMSLASLPTGKPTGIYCGLKWLLAPRPSGRQCVVLTGLLLTMFTDLVASAVTTTALASEQYWGGIAVFLLVVPLATVLGQVMGWVMLFRPAFIRTYISFQIASLLNVAATFLFCLSVEDYFVWSLFLIVDFLCKLLVVRLAAMHLAHAETYTIPTESESPGAELMVSRSFVSSHSTLDI